MDSALSSMSSITRLATTTDTGDPIAVPCICWYTFPRKDRKVAAKQSDRRPVMLFTLRPVLSGRETSLSSFRRATWNAIEVCWNAGEQ